jgi:hypothetical protein
MMFGKEHNAKLDTLLQETKTPTPIDTAQFFKRSNVVSEHGLTTFRDSLPLVSKPLRADSSTIF